MFGPRRLSGFTNSRPFLVMAIIPFGLVGVVLGHYVLGVPISAAGRAPM